MAAGPDNHTWNLHRYIQSDIFKLGYSLLHKVRVTQVPGTKTLINEYNVQSEILNTGMGVSNPEHLDLLRALCQEGKANSSKETSHISG